PLWAGPGRRQERSPARCQETVASRQDLLSGNLVCFLVALTPRVETKLPLAFGRPPLLTLIFRLAPTPSRRARRRAPQTDCCKPFREPDAASLSCRRRQARAKARRETSGKASW